MQPKASGPSYVRDTPFLGKTSGNPGKYWSRPKTNIPEPIIAVPIAYTQSLIIAERYHPSAPAAVAAPNFPAGGIPGIDAARMNTTTPAATKAIN